MSEQQNVGSASVAKLEEDWSMYKKLDFDPQALSNKVKGWLRRYLAEKYPSGEEDRCYKVVKWMAQVSWQSKEWNAENLLEYLWNLLLIDEVIPTVPRVNRLFGELDLPAYTKIWPVLGKDGVWADLLLERAFGEKMNEQQMLRIFGEARVDDYRQRHEQQEKLPEVTTCETVEDVQSGTNESVTVNSSGQLAEQMEQTEQEDTLIKTITENLEAYLNTIDVPHECERAEETEDLREKLAWFLPEWPEDLVEWLATQIESLRQSGMDFQREQHLWEFIAKQDKTNFDYALLATLERSSMQACLTKNVAQKFSWTGMVQLLHDLTVANDNVVPRPVELEQVAELGLSTSEEVESVFGAYRGWRRKIVNALRADEIQECKLSETARKIAGHDFAQKYRLRHGTLQGYRHDDGRLVLFVSFDGDKREQIMLE